MSLGLIIEEARVWVLSLYLDGPYIDRTSLEPDSGTLTITKGTETILDGVAVVVSGNQVSYTISSSNVTASSGKYRAVWTINKDDSVYIHKEWIIVKED